MSAVVPDDASGPSIDVLDAPTAGSKAIRGSAVRGAGYVAGALLALASAPLLINHLRVEDFGRYVSVISLIAIVTGITDVGLGTLALREYSVRSGADRDAFMRSILGARIVVTSAGVLIATAFAAVAGYGATLVLGTLLAGIGAVLGAVGATLGVPLATQLRLGWLTAIELGAKAAGVALIIALVFASAGILPFLAVTVPVGILAVAATAALTRGQVPMRPSLALGELRVLLRETLPLAIALILGTLYARIVIVLMSVIAAGLPTGYFGTAYRVVEVAVGVPAALVGTTFPIMARAASADRDRLRYVLQRILEVALILGVWMSMIIAIAAVPITDLLTRDDEAGPVADVLVVLALLLAPAFVNMTLQTCLLSLREHRSLIVVNGTALAFVVTLTLALVPPFGAEGGAWAVIVGECYLVAAAAIVLVRRHPALRPDLRLMGRLLPATAAASAAGVLPDLPPLAGAVLASVVFFAALVLLGAIPRELYDALRHRRLV